MPRSSSSGSSISKRSDSSNQLGPRAPGAGGEPERPPLEDRPGTVENRARMAGGIHRQPAAGTQWPPGGQHALRLFRECDDLLMAEPEANARRLLGFCRAVLAGRRARHQNEHLAGFVIAEPHLADLPFGLAGRERRLARGTLDKLDPLGLQHLVKAND